MRFSSIIGSTAFVLAGALAPGPGFAETGQERLAQREALRRAAVVEQQKRKEDFALRCIKRNRSDTNLEACRDAYRKLYSPTNSSAF
ncbi:MAG TPA: hypothetical protein VGX52_03205 [Burkholderiales bacterium]|nr:hypothetical protein [Burkholderiales bacterium]